MYLIVFVCATTFPTVFLSLSLTPVALLDIMASGYTVSTFGTLMLFLGPKVWFVMHGLDVPGAEEGQMKSDGEPEYHTIGSGQTNQSRHRKSAIKVVWKKIVSEAKRSSSLIRSRGPSESMADRGDDRSQRGVSRSVLRNRMHSKVSLGDPTKRSISRVDKSRVESRVSNYASEVGVGGGEDRDSARASVVSDTSGKSSRPRTFSDASSKSARPRTLSDASPKSSRPRTSSKTSILETNSGSNISGSNKMGKRRKTSLASQVPAAMETIFDESVHNVSLRQYSVLENSDEDCENKDEGYQSIKSTAR